MLLGCSYRLIESNNQDYLKRIYNFVGMQAIILQLWDERSARGHTSAYHFALAFGAALAPTIGKNKNYYIILPVSLSGIVNW